MMKPIPEVPVRKGEIPTIVSSMRTDVIQPALRDPATKFMLKNRISGRPVRVTGFLIDDALSILPGEVSSLLTQPTESLQLAYVSRAVSRNTFYPNKAWIDKCKQPYSR